MSIPKYRVIVSFDAERKLFVARVPELDPCFAEGASRTEAIAALEQEIEALVANQRERGTRPPPAAVDETQWSGEITAQVSRSLHRELAFQARLEGIELPQLLSEILASGLEARRQARPGRSRSADGSQEGVGTVRDAERSRGASQAARLHTFLEDQANFIEYVRGLESEARGGAGRTGNGRGPRPQGNRNEGRSRRRRGGPFRGERGERRGEGGSPEGGTP
ncbi:MAG: hypothetical protein RMK29_03555 [Myxococcales bacterium]|nr:hypothetical protein [Myxococcota bacterium]MDW8280762.1 hypothetical protein [Myxococcales bacterium]